MIEQALILAIQLLITAVVLATCVGLAAVIVVLLKLALGKQ